MPKNGILFFKIDNYLKFFLPNNQELTIKFKDYFQKYFAV